VSTTAYDVWTPAELEGLVIASPRYQVVAVAQTQELSPTGVLVDAAEISFAIIGRPGVFTVTIPLTTFRIFESGIDLTSAVDEVEAIYAL